MGLVCGDTGQGVAKQTCGLVVWGCVDVVMKSRVACTNEGIMWAIKKADGQCS